MDATGPPGRHNGLMKRLAPIMIAATAAVGAQERHQHHPPRSADEYAKVLESPERDAWQKPHEVIAALALRYKLPLISTQQSDVEAGSLMSYGAVLADNYRRTAGFVIKILKGAKPADLPV